MANPRSSSYYPFAGQLYLACSPSLTQQGLLKFRATTRTALLRAKEHPGVLSTEKSQPVFVLDTLDCRQAEDRLRELFQERRWLPAGRKELARCSLKQATALARQAVQDTALNPRSGPAPQLEQPLGKLSSDHPVAGPLLAMPWSVGKRVLPLEQWLLMSLESASLARKLQRAGVQCTNASRTLPEFRLDGRILLDAQVWLSSQGLKAERMQEPAARLYRWVR